MSAVEPSTLSLCQERSMIEGNLKSEGCIENGLSEKCSYLATLTFSSCVLRNASQYVPRGDALVIGPSRYLQSFGKL